MFSQEKPGFKRHQHEAGAKDNPQRLLLKRQHKEKQERQQPKNNVSQGQIKKRELTPEHRKG
jgi:hypothetical protein